MFHRQRYRYVTAEPVDSSMKALQTGRTLCYLIYALLSWIRCFSCIASIANIHVGRAYLCLLHRNLCNEVGPKK